MTEQQAIEYFHSLPRLSGAPTLTRMQGLLAALGNPEQQFRAVHIAGTNGKGTVACLTASILKAAGYRTGLTISPYVLEFRERFQINGEMIPPQELAALTEEVWAAAATLPEPPVEFEAVTALAFLWFARQKCDIAVVEVGLGGRFDATNVLPPPLVSAIACIGLDHTELLGDTLAAIAAEKAGIIKPGSIVVCYPDQPKEALRELVVAAGAAGCELVVPDKEDLRLLKGRPLENRIDYGGYQAALNFPGVHQAYNATMAVEIALALWRKGLDISDEAIDKGLAEARLPARIEIVGRDPLVILDGCHNPDGMKALAAALTAEKLPRFTAILGMLADKNAAESLAAIAPCIRRAYTVTSDSPRALAAEKLAELARPHISDVTPCASLQQAVDLARADGAPLLICGSLYLAAQARPYFVK